MYREDASKQYTKPSVCERPSGGGEAAALRLGGSGGGVHHVA